MRNNTLALLFISSAASAELPPVDYSSQLSTNNTLNTQTVTAQPSLESLQIKQSTPQSSLISEPLPSTQPKYDATLTNSKISENNINQYLSSGFNSSITSSVQPMQYNGTNSKLSTPKQPTLISAQSSDNYSSTNTINQDAPTQIQGTVKPGNPFIINQAACSTQSVTDNISMMEQEHIPENIELLNKKITLLSLNGIKSDNNEQLEKLIEDRDELIARRDILSELKNIDCETLNKTVTPEEDEKGNNRAAFLFCMAVPYYGWKTEECYKYFKYFLSAGTYKILKQRYAN